MKEPVTPSHTKARKRSPLLKGVLLLAIAGVIASVSTALLTQQGAEVAVTDPGVSADSTTAPAPVNETALALAEVSDEISDESSDKPAAERSGDANVDPPVAALGATDLENNEEEPDELNPNITQIKPGDTVKVSKIPGTIYLRSQNDPDDLIWERLPTYSTYLQVAPPVHQSVKLRFDEGATRGKHLYFQVARSDKRFYMRLRWKDATQDIKSTVDDFRDGVAVQYALKGVDTSYMMGSGAEHPVNIWYWRADQNNIENLAAGGYGSTMLLTKQTVSGDSAYVTQSKATDNAWHVVMSRPLKAKDEHEVNFNRAQVPVAFALWQGSDQERDGNKRVSHTWILLDTGYAAKTKK